MEALSSELCCGCLSSGRKMKSVDDLWSNQTFLQIFTVVMTHRDSSWFCWECEARISNFAAFRNQVKNCSTILQNYAEKNGQISANTQSKLDIYTLPLIDIKSGNQQTFTEETQTLTLFNSNINKIVNKVHIKNEESEPRIINEDTNDKTSNIILHTEVKIESEYSDDDRSLIDIRNECSARKNLPNGHKKIKRKKGKVKLKDSAKLYEEIELSRQEILKERVLMEQREEYVNSMFKCVSCIVTFPNEHDLKDHIHDKHKLHSTKYLCDVCSQTCVSASSLSSHFRRHSSRRRCLFCGHTTATDRAAVAHFTDKHQDSDSYDLVVQAYQNHGVKSKNMEVNGRKSVLQFPCEFCDKIFSWKTSLRKHVEMHTIEAGHKRKPYCETCRLSFTTTSNLQKHVKTSSKHQIQLKLRKLKQDLPEATSDPEQQAKDIETIKCKINSQREQYPCPQCERKFQWKGNLHRHLHSHAAKANGELVCEPCNRTFSSIATYNQHMKISRKHVSENEFKYMCSDCGKRFANKIKLRDHIDWEHLKKYTHRCSVCQKVFKSYTSLYLHRQVVHKHYNSEHLCDHCGKPFPNKTKLRSHIIALHTHESPYKCDICPARFGWHSCLSRHMRRVHRKLHRNAPVDA